MTFMRFDDEVLNAYGVDAKWRPALLSASRSLRQEVLNMGLPNSVSTNSNSNSNPRVSRSANSSPTRPRHSTTSDDLFVSYDYHNDDQEDGYLSSSSRSSISSYSSSILSTTSSHDEHSIGNRNENENENENVTSPRTPPPSPPKHGRDSSNLLGQKATPPSVGRNKTVSPEGLANYRATSLPMPSLFSRNPRYIRPVDFCKMMIDPSVADWAHSRKDSCGLRV